MKLIYLNILGVAYIQLRETFFKIVFLLEMLPIQMHGIQIVICFQGNKSSIDFVFDVIGATSVDSDKDEIFLFRLDCLASLARLFLLWQMQVFDLGQNWICHSNKLVVKLKFWEKYFTKIGDRTRDLVVLDLLLARVQQESSSELPIILQQKMRFTTKYFPFVLTV